MSVINEIIGEQSFEVVRDRVGEILADELAYQGYLVDNNLFDATVYLERFVRFNASELPAINVSVARGALDNHDQESTDNTVTIFIECHAKAKSGTGVNGDTESVKRMQKLVGTCRAILEDSRYKTLGFAPPFVMNRHCSEMLFNVPVTDDSESTCMGRLVLSVRIPESNGLAVPRLLNGYQTTVKISTTEEGYIYLGQ